MRILGFALSASMMFASAQGLALQKKSEWVSFQAKNISLKNTDIEKYIESTQLSDQVKAMLFLKAEKDFDRYQQIKREWIQSQFELGLKNLAYSSMIEASAKSHVERVAFTSTENELDRAINQLETDALASFFKNPGTDIKKARRLKGEELIHNNHPHRAGESGQKVYDRWMEAKKNRLIEEFRNTGITQWLAYKGSKVKLGEPALTKQNIQFAANSIFKNTTQKIKSKWNGQSLSVRELRRLISENPDMKPLLTSVEFQNIPELSMKKHSETSVDQGHGLRKKLTSDLSEKLSGLNFQVRTLVKKAMGRAVNTYKSELQNSVKQKKEMVLKGASNATVLSLYVDQLALSMTRTTKVDTKAIEAQLAKSQKNTLSELSTMNFWSNDMERFYEGAFRSIEGQLGNKILISNNKKMDDHLKSLVSFLVQYQAHEVALDHKSIVTFKVKDFNEKNIEIVRNHYLNSVVSKNVGPYLEGEFSGEWKPYISLSPNKNLTLTGNDALKYIFDKNLTAASMNQSPVVDDQREMDQYVNSEKSQLSLMQKIKLAYDNRDYNVKNFWNRLSKEEKMMATNAAGLAVITVVGFSSWDYGSSGFFVKGEGWFDNDTKWGGADKLGHFWSTYAFSDLLARMYRNWGYESHEASKLAAISSWVVMGLMEVGDSFSEAHGFAPEDLLMNTVGAYVSYYLANNPDMDAKIDLRILYEYNITPGDIMTDYENMKYILALKLDGFEATRNNKFLKYLEVHFGYYTRGFDSDSEQDFHSRNLYFGVALNASRILREQGYKTTADFFEYIQFPYTSVAVGEKTWEGPQN